MSRLRGNGLRTRLNAAKRYAVVPLVRTFKTSPRTCFAGAWKAALSVEIQTPLRFDRLRALREGRGWSQRELARQSGVGDAQISRYESGLSDPTATSLKALAEALDVSIDYLVGLTDDLHGYSIDDAPPFIRDMAKAYINRDVPKLLTLVSDWLRAVAESPQESAEE